MKNYIIRIDWPTGNPSLQEVADLLKGCEIDQSYGIHCIDNWLQRYVVKGKINEADKKELEVLWGIKFLKPEFTIEAIESNEDPVGHEPDDADTFKRFFN